MPTKPWLFHLALNRIPAGWQQPLFRCRQACSACSDGIIFLLIQPAITVEIGNTESKNAGIAGFGPINAAVAIGIGFRETIESRFYRFVVLLYLDHLAIDFLDDSYFALRETYGG